MKEKKRDWAISAGFLGVLLTAYVINYRFGFLEILDFHIEKVKKLLEPHVDPVFWLNVQLIQLQYYAKGDKVSLTIQIPQSNGEYEEKTVEVTLGAK